MRTLRKLNMNMRNMPLKNRYPRIKKSSSTQVIPYLWVEETYSFNVYVFPECGTRHIDCQVGQGIYYNGVVSETEDHIKCQAWNINYPHRTSDRYKGSGSFNYCRNPNDAPRVWCYTTQPGPNGWWWGYCDVRECTPCDTGKA